MTITYPEFFARFYDLIYGQLRDGTDHQYFLEKIKQPNRKILEIGVGTGRFFLDAINHGADIYGIDVSPAMTDILKSNLDQKEHHRISLQSAVDFTFDFKFDLIIAPFHVMMHVYEKESQLAAIKNIYRHLNPGGLFIFDAFVPNLNYLVKGFENQVDFEGEYEPGKKVKRTVTTYPDLIKQLIDVEWTIEWDEDDRPQKETWKAPVRFFFRYELEHLLERSNFKEYTIFGDYHENPLSSTSTEFLIHCTR